MNDDRELAVITGGARGIGLATARRLAEDGFRVAIFDVDAAVLDAAVVTLRAEGHSVDGQAVDVADEAQMIAAFDALPRVDALVTSAAIVKPAPIAELSLDLFRRTLDVNLIGTFLAMRESIKRLPKGGRIVALSTRGVLGDHSLAHYIASKSGIIGLVRAVAFEMRPRLISVNAVAPGSVDTDLFRQLPEERRAALAALEPRGHLAHPAEIAHAISFLASPRTQFITGQTLFVDGGKSLGGFTAPV